MAQLSSGRALHLAAVTVAVVSNIALAAGPARSEVDLNGTWHVLVHYKDDASTNPDRPRWDDRLWSFEPSGGRVRWMEWPIIVFNDDTGRFERRGTGISREKALPTRALAPDSRGRAQLPHRRP